MRVEITTTYLSFRLSEILDMLEDRMSEEADLVQNIKNIGYRCYLEARSNAGDAEAQFGGALYYGFLGYEEDEARALLGSKAAENGHLNAKCQ